VSQYRKYEERNAGVHEKINTALKKCHGQEDAGDEGPEFFLAYFFFTVGC